MKTTALILGLGLLLSGCQTGASLEKHGRLDNAGFMSLWDTYGACKGGTDLEGMRMAARHLHQVAFQPAVATSGELHLPKAIERWVAEQPARLAVDPKSMAAACSLHAGLAALTVGRHDMADEMFRAVLKDPRHTSPYYIEQARAGLTQISTASQASLPLPLQVPRVIVLSDQPAGK